MVIERPLGPFGAPSASGSYFETPKFKVTRGGWIAIGVSLALHVAAGVFIYEQRSAPPPAAPLTPSGAITTADMVRLSDLNPPKPQNTPKIVHVHEAFDPPPTMDKAQVVAQPKPVTADPAGEAKLADTTLTPVQPQQTTNPPARVVRNPTWLERPNAEQLAQYYPARALDLDRTGSVVLDCVVSAHGGLTRCTVASETPPGWGFGDAAQKLSQFFRMSPRTEDGVPVEGGTISVAIRFKTDN